MFYLLFPLVVARLSAIRRPGVIAVALTAYAFTLLAALAYMRWHPDGPEPATPEGRGFWLGILRYHPAVRFPEFLMGMALGRWFCDRAAAAPVARAAGAGSSVVAAVALVLALAFSSRIPYPLLHNGLLAPLFALLVGGLALGGGPLAALLSTKLLVVLGDASYCLYILHVPLFTLWHKAARTMGCEDLASRLPATLCFIGLSVAASVACHRYVERPLRDRIIARMAPRRAPVAEATG
jgi:peptidoglycan/LPS O-acetylase OafA/YrhL